jgi:hypothetical protein
MSISSTRMTTLGRLVLALLSLQGTTHCSMTASAFSTTANKTPVFVSTLVSRQHMFGIPQQQQQQRNNTNKRVVVPLWNVPQTNREELKELPSIVEFPTPSQLKVLRKEATKRQASNTMARALLPPEEMYGPFTSSLPTILSLLEERELVDVRGISKTDNRDVRAIAERLVNDLELELQRDVTIVSIKGYTATLYCPMIDETSSTKIQLFTSVGQKNSWVRRAKAPRDNRGQVIKDNNNNNEATP